jgi:hypothetical protein
MTTPVITAGMSPEEQTEATALDWDAIESRTIVNRQNRNIIRNARLTQTGCLTVE